MKKEKGELKMKKIFIKLCALIMLITMILSINVWADDFERGTGTVRVEKNCIMTLAKSGIKRSVNYSYVMVKANSVYPVLNGVVDDYVKCRTKICAEGKDISDVMVLTEGVLRELHIYEGSLSNNKYDLYFSGNHKDLAAYIAYYYNGK